MLLNTIWKHLGFNTIKLTHCAYRSYSRSLALDCSFAFGQQPHNNAGQLSNQQQRPKGERRDNKSDHTKKQRKQREQMQLTSLLKIYRTDMQEGISLPKFCFHCKQIASGYKKQKHQEYVQQKDQLENMLTSIKNYKLSGMPIQEYFSLLDFLRVTARLQSIAKRVYDQSKLIVMDQLKNYIPNLQQMQLNSLLTLYCKINPLNHPDGFKVGGFLHDGLVQQFNQKNRLNLSTMQYYVVIKSLGKKQFLSYIDKKILEMILLSLKQKLKTLDDNIIIQLVVALKECKVAANISDHGILAIVDRIYQIAVKNVKQGCKYQQLNYLLSSQPTSNPYFQQIYQDIYLKTIERMREGEHKIALIQTLSRSVRHIEHHYQFSQTDRADVIQFLQKIVLNGEQKLDIKSLQLSLLDLLRSNFFGKKLSDFGEFIAASPFQYYWSFPLEFSYRKVAFPLSKFQSKITQTTHKFKIDANHLKSAVAVAVQSKLYPDNQKLSKCHSDMIDYLKLNPLTSKDMQGFIKIAIYDLPLITSYHHHYAQYFSSSLIPSQQNIAKDNNLAKGDKSQLFKFWDYLTTSYNYNSSLPIQLIANMPVYATYLITHRQVNKIADQLPIKPLLLLSIDHKLQSGKIRASDQQISLIVLLMSKYEETIYWESQAVMELYWRIVHKLVQNYSRFKINVRPNVNFLLSKLLIVNSNKVRHSLYFKHFMLLLVSSAGILAADNNHSYFKTAIIREALGNKLISQLHLSQLDWNYFTAKQKTMLKAITNQFQFTEWNAAAVTSYVRMSKPTKNVGNEVQSINLIIENSSGKELQEYLINYSLQRGEFSDNILQNIVKKYIKVIQVKSMDIIGVLANIRLALCRVNLALYKQLINIVCDALAVDPSSHFLIDHLELIKILRKCDVTHSGYENAVWKYVVQLGSMGTVSVDILYELTRRNFVVEDVKELDAVNINILVCPSNCLRVALLHQSQMQNASKLIQKIVRYASRGMPPSLYTALVQKKSKLIVNKTKSMEPLLHQPSQPAQKLLKILQSNHLKVRHQQISSQNIYHIKQKIVIVFIQRANLKQLQFIESTLKFMYPTRAIILVSVDANEMDLKNMLDGLAQLGNDEGLFGQQLCSKIKEELSVM